MSEFAPNADLLGDTPQPLGVELLPDRATRHQGRTVVILPPNPTADTHGEKYLKLYTQNKIRQAFHQLASNNLDAVQTWLHNVAQDSPAKAVELFIELAKFSLPQLKETSVNVTQNGATKTYTSSAELLEQINKPE